MLVLHVLALTLTLTSALHVPNSSEEDWHDRVNAQEEAKSARYAQLPGATGRKQFSSEESVKSVTPATHAYVPGPRSQSLNKEHYPQASINQNSAYGGSFSPLYQAKSYANTDHFSTPYFQNTFGNLAGLKPTSQLKIVVPPQVEKLQQSSSNSEEESPNKKTSLTGLGSLNYEYPFYSSDRNQKEVYSGNVQLPIYRTQYPGPKNSEYVFSYAPGHQSESSVVPTLRSNEKLSQYFPQNEPSATLSAVNKKVASPLVQLPNSQDLQGYLRAFESQPVLLNHDFNYQPSLSFDLANHRQIAQPNNASPFRSPISSFQGQVIPIQTAGSTPQFPQYKGAAVAAFPAGSFDLPKVPGTYQLLRAQPQLHFQSANVAPGLVNSYQNTNVRSKPAEEIREDVEIIKKKPTPAPPKKDDDDFDDGYKSVEAEYGPNSNEEDDYRPSKNFKETSAEGDFKPSKSFPFKEYDEKFGRYSNNHENKDEEEEKPYQSKYQSYSSSENDDDEDTGSSKYTSDYESSEPRRPSYDDEDEEETQRYERKREPEEDSDRKEESKRNKNVGRSFDKEFDEFYKKPVSKNKHVRTKEVPVVEVNQDDYRPPKRYQKNVRGFGLRNEESIAPSNTGYYVPSLANTKVPSISNEKVFRDLTGI